MSSRDTIYIVLWSVAKVYLQAACSTALCRSLQGTNFHKHTFVTDRKTIAIVSQEGIELVKKYKRCNLFCYLQRNK